MISQDKGEGEIRSRENPCFPTKLTGAYNGVQLLQLRQNSQDPPVLPIVCELLTRLHLLGLYGDFMYKTEFETERISSAFFTGGKIMVRIWLRLSCVFF